MRPCNKSIQKTIRMAEVMLSLADQGEAAREDNGCGVLYSVLRDAAYKIKRLAEAEKQLHIRKGWWNSSKEKGAGHE